MRFLFYMPSSTVVRGGISVILDMIDVLNRTGFEALALYERPDFEYDSYVLRAPRLWSPHLVRPRDRRSLKALAKGLLGGGPGKTPGNAPPCPAWTAEPGDVVVVPEYVSDWMPGQLPDGVPRLLFNQNPFSLFRAFTRPGFDRTAFAGALSVSEACAAGCRMVLGPAQTPAHIPLFISKELYAYQPDKRFQVAYMPRKRGADTAALIKALTATKGLEDVPFVPIDGLSNAEAAELLRASLFFLSFAEREGFGLPAAEAMATGALVIGYTGVGGDGFFTEATGFPVPEDNLMAFYSQTVSVIEGYRAEPQAFDARRAQASETILATYNRPRFETEVARVFAAFRDQLGG